MSTAVNVTSVNLAPLRNNERRIRFFSPGYHVAQCKNIWAFRPSPWASHYVLQTIFGCEAQMAPSLVGPRGPRPRKPLELNSRVRQSRSRCDALDSVHAAATRIRPGKGSGQSSWPVRQCDAARAGFSLINAARCCSDTARALACVLPGSSDPPAAARRSSHLLTPRARAAGTRCAGPLR